MEDQAAVLLEIDGPLARITLNRPAVLTRENLAWVRALGDAVDAVAAEPAVRVVLVRGAGRAFCAGMDLDMLGSVGMPPGFYEGQERALRTLETMDKIVIAALHGDCLGGGLQLAIACDIRVTSADCRIGLPAAREGVFPGMAVFRLPRPIGLGPARRLVLSGETIGADEALRLGLVDHVVPATDFAAAVPRSSIAHLSTPPTAAITAKRLMDRAFEAPFVQSTRNRSPSWLHASPHPKWQRQRMRGDNDR